MSKKKEKKQLSAVISLNRQHFIEKNAVKKEMFKIEKKFFCKVA